MAKVFNPSEFGFDNSTCRGSRRDRVEKGCYLQMSKPSKTDGERTLRLVVDDATSRKIREAFGDRVEFALDGKGRIAVYKASGAISSRKLSKRSNGFKYEMSMNTAVKELTRIHGTFSRLYMTAEDYAGGSAVVFTSTGVKDMM